MSSPAINLFFALFSFLIFSVSSSLPQSQTKNPATVQTLNVPAAEIKMVNPKLPPRSLSLTSSKRYEGSSDLVHLRYHMGPVLSSAPINIYVIWYGRWSRPHKALIRDFLNSISDAKAPSPSVAEWWRTASLYTDQTGANVSRSVLIAGEYSDAKYSHGQHLTRLSIQEVIASAARSASFPVDHKNGMYLVLTSHDVTMQDFCRAVCGFHYFTFPSMVGYTMPYAWVGQSGKQCPEVCAYPFALPGYMGKKKQIMALSSSCSTLKAVNSRWTSPVPKLAALRRQYSLLPELRYTPNVKLTATNALRTVEQTTLTEDNKLSTYGSDQEDQESLPKPRILVAEKLGEAGVNLLKDFGDVDCSYELSPEDLKKKVAESDALIVRSGTKVTREVFEAAKGRLKVVGRAGVGIDNVDLQAATEYGCLVVNAPTANTVAAAEHGIALLASMARNVAQADASIKAGKWERSKYVGVSLVGKTLAIMGFGKVGTEVARRAKGLGMNVISHDPYAPADRARALGVELVSFDQAISTADFISLHMPLTPATKKVFNDETFSKMKKGVRLINVARGGVIDEDALVRALDSGVVAQAALDVFCEEPPSKESRLIQHENVTVTPHLGASTKEAQEGVAIEIAEAVAGALRGELSATAVNAPMVAPEVLSELAPYIVLAEKLGRLAVQLASGGKGVQSIKVVYRSARDRDDLDTRLLRAMITKGIIEPISDSYVNLVNADFIAKQKGLRISEERTMVESSPEYPVDSIQVQISNVESSFAGAVSDAGAISIEGKVKYGVPHLTCVGSFGVDVSLEGNLILCRQVDQPGMIGQVGNILGEQNVNVSFMSVGRTVVRKQAIMAIGVDEEPDKKTLEKIGGVSAIEEFVFLKL